MGRPSDYSQELVDRICAELALGRSLRSVCADDEMPSMTSVFNWLRIHPEFLEQYTRAKEESADALTDEMLDIADDATNDWMERKNSDGSTHEVVDGDHIQRSRLRIETRKWIASKLKPKKYGEKLEHSGSIGHTYDALLLGLLKNGSPAPAGDPASPEPTPNGL